MSDDLKVSSDLESNEARHPEENMKRGLTVPQPRRIEMPSMSDDEVYSRLNVPSGLQTNGTWPKHYGIVQRSHKDESDTSIKTEDGR
jgi:hypothetical protein